MINVNRECCKQLQLQQLQLQLHIFTAPVFSLSINDQAEERTSIDVSEPEPNER
jgi:hypothetical protein